MDGLDALAHLRKVDTVQGVPIIALSPHTMPQDIVPGLRPGFDNYVTKPIEVDEVVNPINAAMHAGG